MKPYMEVIDMKPWQWVMYRVAWWLFVALTVYCGLVVGVV